MREPGLFGDVLVQTGKDVGHALVQKEIEKDVGRTMPLNIFFGGMGRACSPSHPAGATSMIFVATTVCVVHICG
jgi:hypothetical protein